MANKTISFTKILFMETKRINYAGNGYGFHEFTPELKKKLLAKKAPSGKISNKELYDFFIDKIKEQNKTLRGDRFYSNKDNSQCLFAIDFNYDKKIAENFCLTVYVYNSYKVTLATKYAFSLLSLASGVEYMAHRASKLPVSPLKPFMSESFLKAFDANFRLQMYYNFERHLELIDAFKLIPLTEDQVYYFWGKSLFDIHQQKGKYINTDHQRKWINAMVNYTHSKIPNTLFKVWMFLSDSYGFEIEPRFHNKIKIQMYEYVRQFSKRVEKMEAGGWSLGFGSSEHAG